MLKNVIVNTPSLSLKHISPARPFSQIEAEMQFG